MITTFPLLEQDDSYLFFHTLTDDTKRLEDLLLQLAKTRTYRCRCVYERYLPVLNRVIFGLNMYKSYEMACYLVHMPREIPLTWGELE